MTEDRKPISKLDLQNRITILESDIRYLKEQIRDHGKRFYRYGELEAQLITRMDALENPQDVKEPEDAPERDFPCCERPGGHDVPPMETVPLLGESPSDYWYRQYCLVKQELNRHYS